MHAKIKIIAFNSEKKRDLVKPGLGGRGLGQVQDLEKPALCDEH